MMEINKIKIGERHRKELGDLAAFADNIKTVGLLHPPGITEDNELIFGYRRLLACRDHLGWTEIDVRVINVPSIIAGEYAENEMRKDFTASERMAIWDEIEHKTKGGDRKSKEYIPLIIKRQAAVRLAGLGNTTSARQVKLIFKDGIPELREAVDRREIAIEPGFAVALQPPERQAEIVKMPIAERRAVIRELDRPGKNPGQATRKRQQCPNRSVPRNKPAKRIDPPYLLLQAPTLDETERPPKGAGLQAHLDYTEKHGKVELYPTRIKRLLDCQGLVEGRVQTIVATASNHQPDAEEFFSSVEQMLAYVRQCGKTNGQEIDFAKAARGALVILERDLDKAIDQLTALRASFAAYKRGEAAPLSESGAEQVAAQ
jgi:hypothetical protein